MHISRKSIRGNKRLEKETAVLRFAQFGSDSDKMMHARNHFAHCELYS
jgi:hypothetical protein